MRTLLCILSLLIISVPAWAETTPMKMPPPPPPRSAETPPPPSDPIPADLQGIWSAPDCTSAKHVLIIAPHHSLFYRPGMYNLTVMRTWRQEDDNGDTLYNFNSGTNTPVLMRKTNDGLMKVRFVSVNPKAPLKNSWGGQDDKIAMEFAHCAKLFDSHEELGQDEVDAVFLLDSIVQACYQVWQQDFKTATACHRTIFNLADTNKDQALDRDELSRFYRQTAFVLAASVYCGGIAYPDNTVAEGSEFADSILGTDKKITFDQIIAKFSDAQFMQGRVLAFSENARSSTSILPFLPPSEAPRGCSMVAPGDVRNLGTVLLLESAASKSK